jgi:hypothetical protein
LVQPLEDYPEEDIQYYSEDMEGTYITTATVKFLEAAGARVVPLNYRLRNMQLTKQLKQLNGVYIPGDRIENLSNPKYLDTIE